MEFKTWLNENADFGHWLMSEITKSILNAPVDHIDLGEEEFDVEEAEYECANASHHEDFSYHVDLPTSPEEDSDFEGIHVDQWEEEYPEPDEDDFESEEEYEDALKKWKEERDQVESDYEDEVEAWEEEMAERRREEEDEARDEWIQDCIEQKRIDHEDDDKNLSYSWEDADGDPYEVSFEETSERINGEMINHIWYIEFEGPESHGLTHKGQGASMYKQLLLAIKRLIQTQTVNGLSFTPADPKMGVMYHKFLTTFNKSLEDPFLPASDRTFVRKSVIKSHLRYKKDDEKVKAYKGILDASRGIRSNLKDIKNTETEKRNNIIKLRTDVATITIAGEEFPALVSNIRYDGPKQVADVIVTKNGDDLRKIVVDLDNLEPGNKMSGYQKQQFIDKARAQFQQFPIKIAPPKIDPRQRLLFPAN